jgi:glycosyltransferase involved in cell wall biosynthesis
MKIAIDAKSFYTGPVSTRIILKNLVPELVKLFPDVDWIIFLDKKDKSLDFPCKEKNVHLQYIWAGVNQISNLFVLPRFSKRHNIDLTIYQMFPAIGSPTPSITFIHDVLFRDFPEFFTWKERLYFFSMTFLTRKVNRVMTTTDFVASDLVKHNYLLDRSLIDIVPLGVSSEFKSIDQHDPLFLESVKKRLNLPDRFLLFVGRLNVRKNLESLLKAITMIQDKQIPLVVVGKAEWKAPVLNKILSDPALKNRIHMIGNINDKDLIAVYALSHIFCFPSFAEGFGLPPLEAMASGVPVIVSNTTSLPEVCGDAAIYADPGQPLAIAEAINNLLASSALYEQKKNEGIKRAAQFTWEKTAMAFMNSIYKVLRQS